MNKDFKIEQSSLSKSKPTVVKLRMSCHTEIQQENQSSHVISLPVP